MLLVSGCKEDQKIEAMAKELKQSQEKILKLESELQSLTSSINEDRAGYKWDNFIRNADQIAYLTPGSDGYSNVRFDLGVLTVNLADIKPYANGTKVSLEFGNVLSATVNGLKATIDWGKVDDKGSPINEQAKSKEVIFAESLQPGTWTKVSVSLDGVPANELGFIRVRGITHSGIRLSKK